MTENTKWGGRTPFVPPAAIETEDTTRLKHDLERVFNQLSDTLNVQQQSIPNTYTVQEPSQTFLGMQVLVHSNFDYSGWSPALPSFGEAAVVMWLTDPLPERLTALVDSSGNPIIDANGRWVLLHDFN